MYGRTNLAKQVAEEVQYFRDKVYETGGFHARWLEKAPTGQAIIDFDPRFSWCTGLYRTGTEAPWKQYGN